MENKNPIWSRLWVIWFVLTFVYLLFYSLHWFGIITNIIGLFVPFGLWNGAAFVGALSDWENIWAVVVGIFSLFVIFSGNIILTKFTKLTPVWKLIVGLVILLLITMLVDFSIWGKWESLRLINGAAAKSGDFFHP